MENRFGLRPASEPDGSPTAIEIEERFDRLLLPRDVTTFNLYPAGGLMSYGAPGQQLATAVRAHMRGGELLADLPVQQSASFELVINLRTAKAFGLSVPLALLGRADEVIE